MSETNKDIAVAFYKAVIEGRVEDAFRLSPPIASTIR
jgi:hypothetical protein